MIEALAALMLTNAPPSFEAEARACAAELGASAIAHRLLDLPEEIRRDLQRTDIFHGERLADSEAPILWTDAPSVEEQSYATIRFSHAMLVRDKWIVQFQVSLMAGVSTISYRRRPEGHFGLQPNVYLAGPVCASIKAALDGVYNPRGF
jgi:hypothetical protein